MYIKQIILITFPLLSFNASAEWGEQWGSMVWGQSSANVPMMGGISQFIFFGLLLLIGVFVTKHWGLIKTLPAVAVLSLVPLLADANEIQLNTFQNGEVADADKVNENFTNLKTAIENTNGIGNLITRQSTMQIHNNSWCINGECYTYVVFDGFSACSPNEVALTGGCRVQRNNVDDRTFVNSQSSYTANNRHYCAGNLSQGSEHELNLSAFTITAYVTCLSQ